MILHRLLFSVFCWATLISCSPDGSENSQANSAPAIERPDGDIKFIFDSAFPNEISTESLKSAILSSLRSSIKLGQKRGLFSEILTDDGYSQIWFESISLSQVGTLESIKSTTAKVATGDDKSFVEGTFSDDLEVVTFKIIAEIKVFGRPVTYTSAKPFFIHRKGKVDLTVSGKVNITELLESAAVGSPKLFMASAALNQVVPDNSYISATHSKTVSSSNNVPYSSNALSQQIGSYDFNLLAKRFFDEIVLGTICETLVNSNRTSYDRTFCVNSNYFNLAQQFKDEVGNHITYGTDSEDVLSPVIGCLKDGNEIQLGLRVPDALVGKLTKEEYYPGYSFFTLEPYGEKSLFTQKIGSLHFPKEAKNSEPIVTPIGSKYEYFEQLCNESIPKKPMELVRASASEEDAQAGVNVNYLNDPTCLKVVVKKAFFSDLYSHLSCDQGKQAAYNRGRILSTDLKSMVLNIYGSFSKNKSTLYQISDRYSDDVTSAILDGKRLEGHLQPVYFGNVNHGPNFEPENGSILNLNREQ